MKKDFARKNPLHQPSTKCQESSGPSTLRPISLMSLMDNMLHDPNWGFPKIRGTLLGAPIIRIIVFWVYIGVPLFWETTNYTTALKLLELWYIGFCSIQRCSMNYSLSSLPRFVKSTDECCQATASGPFGILETWRSIGNPQPQKT